MVAGKSSGAKGRFLAARKDEVGAARSLWPATALAEQIVAGDSGVEGCD
jgi:hypothetical protein